MRWLINYIRQCFCKHDFELLTKYRYRDPWAGDYILVTYRCKKCGYIQKNHI